MGSVQQRGPDWRIGDKHGTSKCAFDWCDNIFFLGYLRNGWLIILQSSMFWRLHGRNINHSYSNADRKQHIQRLDRHIMFGPYESVHIHNACKCRY